MSVQSRVPQIPGDVAPLSHRDFFSIPVARWAAVGGACILRYISITGKRVPLVYSTRESAAPFDWHGPHSNIASLFPFYH